MIGTTLDKYEVLQKVGEGGMATVYRGRHSTLDRIVAIKILHPHLSSSVRNRARFAREVEAIERLRHENILEIFDYSGNDAADCYLVMEFVEGETLTELVNRRGRLPSEIVCQIGVYLCRALGYAHSQGVLHRDVKPENVMVRVDGVVKLMDFGIARFLDESRVTMTGALVGSPAFMSPEQAREATLDQRSDLFSLGTVLFFLVTGTLPFTGSNPSLILKNVIEGNRPQAAELAPTMSAALADVVERLMSTNPDDRFTRAQDVEDHLLAALEETEVGAEPAGTGVAAPEWALDAWIRDPDEYEQRLDAHLKRALIGEGRRLLASGDHLAALRLLNRLLSMDEANAEVLALVQGLHGESAVVSNGRPRLLGWVALLAIGAAVAALYAGGVRWKTPDAAPPPASARALPGPAPAPPPSTDAVAAPAVLSPAPPTTERPTEAAAPQPRSEGEAPRSRTLPPRTWEVPSAATSAPREAPAKGSIHLNSRRLVADVYLDGAKIGDTREDVELPPGTYDLLLRHPLLYDKIVKVSVAAGEWKPLDVELTPRPATVTFDRSYPGECALRRDGADVGSLTSLEWRVEVERPDRPVTLVLACPDGQIFTDHRPIIGAATVPFTPDPAVRP